MRWIQIGLLLLVASAAFGVGTNYSIVAPNDNVTIAAQFNMAGDAQVGSSNAMLATDRLAVTGALRTTPSGATPSCAASTRGMIWFKVNTAGHEDCLHVCIKNAQELYFWYDFLYVSGGHLPTADCPEYFAN